MGRPAEDSPTYGRYVQVSTSVVDDRDFRALSPSGKLVWLTLRASPENPLAGIFVLHTAVIIARTGLPRDAALAALRELQHDQQDGSGPWIYLDWLGEDSEAVIWMRNQLKATPSASLRSHTIQKNITMAIARLPKTWLAKAIIEYYQMAEWMEPRILGRIKSNGTRPPKREAVQADEDIDEMEDRDDKFSLGDRGEDLAPPAQRHEQDRERLQSWLDWKKKAVSSASEEMRPLSCFYIERFHAGMEEHYIIKAGGSLTPTKLAKLAARLDVLPLAPILMAIELWYDRSLGQAPGERWVPKVARDERHLDMDAIAEKLETHRARMNNAGLHAQFIDQREG